MEGGEQRPYRSWLFQHDYRVFCVAASGWVIAVRLASGFTLSICIVVWKLDVTALTMACFVAASRSSFLYQEAQKFKLPASIEGGAVEVVY